MIGLVSIDDLLKPAIDANPNDKLLMEMLDMVTDARESVRDPRDLLKAMRRRDASKVP